MSNVHLKFNVSQTDSNFLPNPVFSVSQDANSIFPGASVKKREEDCVITEAENGMLQLQAKDVKDCSQPPAKRGKWILP